MERGALVGGRPPGRGLRGGAGVPRGHRGAEGQWGRGEGSAPAAPPWTGGRWGGGHGRRLPADMARPLRARAFRGRRVGGALPPGRLSVAGRTPLPTARSWVLSRPSGLLQTLAGQLALAGDTRRCPLRPSVAAEHSAEGPSRRRGPGSSSGVSARGPSSLRTVPGVGGWLVFCVVHSAGPWAAVVTDLHVKAKVGQGVRPSVRSAPRVPGKSSSCSWGDCLARGSPGYLVPAPPGACAPRRHPASPAGRRRQSQGPTRLRRWQPVDCFERGDPADPGCWQPAAPVPRDAAWSVCPEPSNSPVCWFPP